MLFLSGSLVSWVGDWMDLAALNWAVLQMTDSPFDLGLINACRLVPVFALSIPAGVLADRHDRRRLLLILQTGMMLLTFGVGALFAVRASFWVFAIAVTLRSSLAAMAIPIRTAILPNLVERSAQSEAIAVQSVVMNLSRIIGPALAGWLLAIVSTESVFWINGASFVAVLGTTWWVRPLIQTRTGSRSTIANDFREAIAYIRAHRLVQSLLVLAVVPMIFGFPYVSLMPLFARDLYGLGPEGFGALLSISALGALVGAGWLSFSGGMHAPGRYLVGSIVLFGAALLLCAWTNDFVVATIGMFVVGLASQSYRTLSRITLQAEVPDHMRGRILSIALLDRGFIPLGAVLLGAIAEAVGTRSAGLVMGAACILLTLIVVRIDRRVWRL